MFARKLLNFKKTVVNPVFLRQMAHAGVTPGSSMPFRKCVGNPNRCAMMFILFFGTGFWIPCVAIIYLMHK